MKEMPKHSPFRPHFMAPGPHVDILKDKPISFEDSNSTNDNKFDEDDDEDFRTYKYYPSNKILGKLFSAIDEREIFRRVQQIRLGQPSHHDRLLYNAKSVLEDVWDYVSSRFTLINWEGHLDRARGIRDE